MAILANPAVRAIVDLDGLRELVAFTMTPKWALRKGMREVEPGRVLSVVRTGLRERVYWRLTTAAYEDEPDTTVGPNAGCARSRTCT